MRKTLKIALLSCLFFNSFWVIAQVNCDTTLVPPVTLANGNIVTSTITGRVDSYETPFTSCGNVTTPANSILLGSDNYSGPTNFTYTINFSIPVNNIQLNITGTGSTFDEFFTITTDVGNPTITTFNSCFTIITNNTIASGLNSDSSGGGGEFLITTANNFSQITVSGPGGVAGSLLSFCQNSIEAACPDTLILTSGINNVSNLSLPVIGTRQIQASNWINTTNTILIGDNSFGNGVIFHAENFVEMNPGFEALLGSQFSAYPLGCSNTYNYRHGNVSATSINPKVNYKMSPIQNFSFDIIYNPSNNFIDVIVKNFTLKKIIITSIEGKTVYEKAIYNQESLQIDISSYENGLYLVSVITEDSQTLTEKLIKK